MRQRVMIAMALANNPELLIADEPTTALDVTIQAQILALLRRLQTDFGSAIILVTHDLGVVAETADDVLVMYAARRPRRAGMRTSSTARAIPYTWGLLDSLPRLAGENEELTPIRGRPPSLLHPPAGCRFNQRCDFVMDVCRKEQPPLERAPGASHRDACFLDSETKDRESAPLITRIKEAR